TRLAARPARVYTKRASCTRPARSHGPAFTNLGIGLIFALGLFPVPLPVGRLVFDLCRLAFLLMLRRSDFRRSAGIGMRGECFGKDIAELVGPASIMLHDLIGDFHQFRSEVILPPSWSQ